jgi:hypothetical protein
MDLANAYNKYGLVAHALELREVPGFGEVATERTLAVVNGTQCPFRLDNLQVGCVLGAVLAAFLSIDSITGSDQPYKGKKPRFD